MRELDAKEKQVLFLINTDADHRRDFFTRAKTLKWFEILRELHFFDPDKIPFDQEGHALFWDVLSYLERVSEQVADSPDYAKQLIQIVDDVVEFSRIRKQIGNYHIWWYCAKIFNNLPLDAIAKNLTIERFRVWLVVWTNYAASNVLSIGEIGQKLLPKLLAHDVSISYAEVVVEEITKIKPPQRERIGSMRESPIFVWESYWVTDAFHKNYQAIGAKCSDATILLIADRLKAALEFRHKDYHANYEIGDQVYQIEVSRVQVKGSPGNTIEFALGQYKCTVSRFTPAQLSEAAQRKDFFKLHNAAPEELIADFSFSASDGAAFATKLKENLPATVDWLRADKFELRLASIYDGLYSDYSYISNKSLATGGRDYANGADDLLTTILRDVLIAKCESNQRRGKEVLDQFLSRAYPFPLFKRLVLVGIDKFWEAYSETFDRFLDSFPGAFSEPDYEVELHDILRHHNGEFRSQTKNTIKELLLKIPEYYVQKGERMSAYWKFKWLSPMRENPDFASLYEEAKRIAAPEKGKPYEPERSSFTGGVVVHKSPLSKDEILQKPIAELTKYLEGFKGADFWHGTFEGEPDKEGLAEAIQAAVKECPEKFTVELETFLETNYFYIRRILRGLKEAWGSGKDIGWNQLLRFIAKYLQKGKEAILREAAGDNDADGDQGIYLGIVADIADIIDSASKDDKRTIDPQYFDQVETVFDLLFPLLKGEADPDIQRDALSYALNTSLGRTIMSYLSFTRRVARATNKAPENWGQRKFDRFFNLGIEAYVWLGSELPLMRFLDRPYTDNKVAVIAQSANLDLQQQRFMEGYLRGCRVYKDLYIEMRPHYLKALKASTDKDFDRLLVQHIALGYLHLGESLEQKNDDGQDSLLWLMLDKPDRWIELIEFLWSITRRTLKEKLNTPDGELTEEVKKKIVSFWRWTYDKREFVKAKLDKVYPSFLGRLIALTILLDRIDVESEQWLLLSVPYVEDTHYAPFFIEYLTKFSDAESIKGIGRIFRKLLENWTPSFREEDIALVVRNIFEKGDDNDAENICETYGRRGLHFLKPVWDTHHKR